MKSFRFGVGGLKEFRFEIIIIESRWRMPSYFCMSKIDINILLEFVLPAEKIGGWVGAEKY